MKTYTGILAIFLVLGLLVIPGVSAADDDLSTDPNLDNNQANVTVDPYSEIPEVTNTTTKKTIPMQKTGVPIAGALAATLMILAGIGLSKRQ
ncbi:hypothetical protein [Methanobacterium sp.]|uniref:hypothetical protein n=1 Tax=Methanobacterium sp. TaxID=2164 RepID=UPI003C7259CB